jgi:hypothetical protein
MYSVTIPSVIAVLQKCFANLVCLRKYQTKMTLTNQTELKSEKIQE